VPYPEWWPEEFEEDPEDVTPVPDDEAEAGTPDVPVVFDEDLPF